MAKTYKMTIAGCERELPMFPINEKIDIAAFIMFGDVEVTIAAAKELLAKVPEFDIIVTPETKSVPLVYEMSRQCGKEYIVARKRPKLYMRDILTVEVNSITTDGMQMLCMGGDDADKIKGKRVLVVDDVISTGESLKAVQTLVNKAEGNIVASAAVLAEGDAANRDDIIFLEPLPLFTK